MFGNETEKEEARARLQDACDVHTMNHGRRATVALLERIAGVSEVRAIPDAKIAEVLEAIRQDIAAARERRAHRHAGV